LLEYLESSGVGLSHYAGELFERRQRGWAFGQHLLPHDAKVRELGSGRSRVETLASLGINATVLPASDVADGINAVRAVLPRCWFDEEKCRRGLEALRSYRQEWNDRLKAFSGRPLHDWASHAADAFRGLAMGLPEQAKPRNRERRVFGAQGW